jgi:hypothetical protein
VGRQALKLNIISSTVERCENEKDNMNISDCYDLHASEINPSDLLLDPNNPRLQLGWSKHYDDSEIDSMDLQDSIYQTILKRKHRTDRLINSIKRQGFIKGSNDLVIRKLTGSKKYVVLEGNRRTASIRYLLSNKNDLAPHVKESLSAIPVKTFKYQKNSTHSREDVIDVLFGIIHLEGPEAWGSMESAAYYNRAYERELIRQTNPRYFHWDEAIGAPLAERVNTTLPALKKMIGIYRVYANMKKKNYKVSTDSYSLLEMAITKTAVNKTIFEYDSKQLRMASIGMDRFSRLCLEDCAPVTNPQSFNAFAFIVKNGTEYQVDMVLEQKQDPLEVKRKAQKTKKTNQFRNRMQELTAELKKIKLEEFKGTEEEMRLFTTLKRTVDEIGKKIKKLSR